MARLHQQESQLEDMEMIIYGWVLLFLEAVYLTEQGCSGLV
jgi:hypothetical protein